MSNEIRTGSHTFVNDRTGDRTWVNKGQVFHPDQSRVDDVHLSRSGKSEVIEHRDGVREIIDLRTGQDRFQRSNPPRPDYRPAPPPVYVDRHDFRPTPPPVYRPSYPTTRIEINLGGLTITEHNRYLREKLYISAPVYVGNTWTPPVFTPVVYNAAVPFVPLASLYRADRQTASIRSMTGAEYLAPALSFAGIYNDHQLLDSARTPEQRQALTSRTGADPYELRKAVGQADLMRIDGIGAHNSRLLVDAGIRSVQDLARYTWDVGMLVNALQAQAYARGNSVPSAAQVMSWVEQARSLPVAVYDNAYDPLR